ncbi:hypothetical protein NDU88_001507 [Pleurodeles waltl]|uniref:Uncharacterized protein n=1 Tax=Pleurodeles waltl TaxID=8319 RepID=A0AAV7Q7B7_PLEWA|nr:hypothetical protein NDU88_001497 [Pleurodeles waltl]KAJ1135059.1 hypothetical protein NDU88_001504 [Pleurodeles waltl]KAJ1135062.1 hypothetical protein NDU88_001507 [Pleurodeles waltl]
MYYDAKHKCKEQAIKVGDVVRVKKPGFIKKVWIPCSRQDPLRRSERRALERQRSRGLRFLVGVRRGLGLKSEVGPSGPGCQVMGVRRSSGVRGRGAATPYKCQHEESSRPRPCADIKSSRPRPMDGYEGESGKVTFYDDSVGSFERDLVYALDAGVRHTVNVALDKATQTIKHLLMGFTDQQGWVPHCSSQEELPFSQDPSGSSSVANPHQADLNKL